MSNHIPPPLDNFASRQMIKTMARHVPLALLLLTLAALSFAGAKRSAPKPVPPVTKNGIRYSAPNDRPKVGYVLATEAQSGRKLWDLVIYETKIYPEFEEDVQWVFITHLKLDRGFLLVQDEKSRCYRVDLKSRRVQTQSCLFTKF